MINQLLYLLICEKKLIIYYIVKDGYNIIYLNMSDYEYDSDINTNDEQLSQHSSDSEEEVVVAPPKKSEKKKKDKKVKKTKEQVSEDEEELGANDTQPKDDDNGFSQKIKMVNDVICSITEHHTKMMEAFKESYNTYKQHITEYKQQMKDLSLALKNVEKYRKDVVKAHKKRKTTGNKTSGINAKKPVPQILIDFFELDDDAEKTFNEVVALMRNKLAEFKTQVNGEKDKKINMYELDKRTLKELKLKKGNTLEYKDKQDNDVVMELHKFPLSSIQKFVKYFYSQTNDVVSATT